MKSILGILIMTAIVAVNGCKSQPATEGGGVAVIDLASEVGKGKIVNLSEVASDIRYVKLETTEGSLIGAYPKVFYENDRIYVISSKMIKVFDKDGKFLFTFDKSGNGPNEYQFASNMRIMPYTGGITVQTFSLDSKDKLLFFDRDGNFEKSKEVPRIKATSQERTINLNDSIFIGSAAPRHKDSLQIFAIVYDSTFNVVKNILMPFIPEYEQMVQEVMASRAPDGTISMLPGRIYYSVKPPELYIFKNSVRLITAGNDTIFTLDSQLNYSPAFSINYGKYKNISAKRDNITKLDGDHISIVKNFFIETQENIILQFYMRNFCHEPYELMVSTTRGLQPRRHTDCYALYNKKSGKFTFLNQPVKGMLGFKEDLQDGPAFLPISISSDFQASALFTASEIIDFAAKNEVKGELRKIVKGLNDTDNPVIAIAKMR
ncbi:MAG: hypothetical protein CVU13_09875 [Bacteroidetes bacterium HGW-Bacteroidetes-8]|jgi:hypothetical protein|nr:MAG: hypothetical protein CVU13_09875 [Bacteroidetes bacterium HGW-Bacteroidetes-8]